ncbi:hypothetical protein HAX54_002445, partial [Datura stramonium]|nr:hypothetical protein [Datura stramonium]
DLSKIDSDDENLAKVGFTDALCPPPIGGNANFRVNGTMIHLLSMKGLFEGLAHEDLKAFEELYGVVIDKPDHVESDLEFKKEATRNEKPFYVEDSTGEVEALPTQKEMVSNDKDKVEDRPKAISPIRRLPPPFPQRLKKKEKMKSFASSSPY